MTTDSQRRLFIERILGGLTIRRVALPPYTLIGSSAVRDELLDGKDHSEELPEERERVAEEGAASSGPQASRGHQ